MLVLTRKINETITVGDDIEVTITEIFPDKVRIGIVAPNNVAVHRKEVAVQIESQLSSDGASEE